VSKKNLWSMVMVPVLPQPGRSFDDDVHMMVQCKFNGTNVCWRARTVRTSNDLAV